MYKIFLALIASFLTQIALANARIQIDVKGNYQTNKWFLCLLSEGGCLSLKTSSTGKIYPLLTHQLQKVYLLNIKNLKLYSQTLPDNCRIALGDNQTLHIRGQITEKNKQIAHLQCQIMD